MVGTGSGSVGTGSESGATETGANSDQQQKLRRGLAMNVECGHKAKRDSIKQTGEMRRAERG